MAIKHLFLILLFCTACKPSDSNFSGTNKSKETKPEETNQATLSLGSILATNDSSTADVAKNCGKAEIVVQMGSADARYFKIESDGTLKIKHSEVCGSVDAKREEYFAYAELVRSIPQKKQNDYETIERVSLPKGSGEKTFIEVAVTKGEYFLAIGADINRLASSGDNGESKKNGDFETPWAGEYLVVADVVIEADAPLELLISAK
jgi:hypothetical protein